MDKTIMELKGFLVRTINREREIEIEIRYLRKEYESLKQVEHELEKIIDTAELENEESEDSND